MTDAIYSVASALGHPFSLVAALLVVLCVGYRTAIGRGGLASRMVLILGVALYVLANPFVSRLATRSLESLNRPASREELLSAEAMVVLAGGFRRGPDNRGELALDTVSRCLRAADIYRSVGPRPIIVSGGLLATGPDDIPVSSGMKRLLMDLGIPESDVVEEPRSRTTFENAVESQKLLAARALRRIALVTSATHLPRSVLVFRAQGLDVIPVGAGYAGAEPFVRALDVIPSATSVDTINRAAHEWVGLAWYWLHRRL